MIEYLRSWSVSVSRSQYFFGIEIGISIKIFWVHRYRYRDHEKPWSMTSLPSLSKRVWYRAVYVLGYCTVYDIIDKMMPRTHTIYAIYSCMDYHIWSLCVWLRGEYKEGVEKYASVADGGSKNETTIAKPPSPLNDQLYNKKRPQTDTWI